MPKRKNKTKNKKKKQNNNTSKDYQNKILKDDEIDELLKEINKDSNSSESEYQESSDDLHNETKEYSENFGEDDVKPNKIKSKKIDPLRNNNIERDNYNISFPNSKIKRKISLKNNFEDNQIEKNIEKKNSMDIDDN